MTKKKRKPHATPSSRSRPFTERDVRDMLANPIYGYGIVLEPFETVIQRVEELQLHLAAERLARGAPFTPEELDERFQALFQQLVNDGTCVRGTDAPAIVGKEMWLKSQQVAIERLAASKQP